MSSSLPHRPKPVRWPQLFEVNIHAIVFNKEINIRQPLLPQLPGARFDHNTNKIQIPTGVCKDGTTPMQINVSNLIQCGPCMYVLLIHQLNAIENRLYKWDGREDRLETIFTGEAMHHKSIATLGLNSLFCVSEPLHDVMGTDPLQWQPLTRTFPQLTWDYIKTMHEEMQELRQQMKSLHELLHTTCMHLECLVIWQQQRVSNTPRWVKMKRKKKEQRRNNEQKKDDWIRFECLFFCLFFLCLHLCECQCKRSNFHIGVVLVEDRHHVTWTVVRLPESDCILHSVKQQT